MSGTTQYTYNLIDASGATDTIVVTVNDLISNTTGAGDSQSVIAIAGNIDGQMIVGEVGFPGVAQQTGNDLFDNAIFQAAGTGLGGGNLDGIDHYGLEFQTTDGSVYNLYDNDGTLQLLDINGNVVENLTLVSANAPCFCAGTLIATDCGDVLVESLAEGDLVLTTEGDLRPIRWIGRRVVVRRLTDRLKATPVRIMAGALDENVPAYDTLLSPCHAVLVDGVLVQAGALVNGISIVREWHMPEIFTYYHVELADHALILAHGMPAETFVDNVDRMGFDNWAEHQALFGESTEIVEMAYPRAKSSRQLPRATRLRLSARAGQIGTIAA